MTVFARSGRSPSTENSAYEEVWEVLDRPKVCIRQIFLLRTPCDEPRQTFWRCRRWFRVQPITDPVDKQRRVNPLHFKTARFLKRSPVLRVRPKTPFVKHLGVFRFHQTRVALFCGDGFAAALP